MHDGLNKVFCGMPKKNDASNLTVTKICTFFITYAHRKWVDEI